MLCRCTSRNHRQRINVQDGNEIEKILGAVALSDWNQITYK